MPIILMSHILITVFYWYTKTVLVCRRVLAPQMLLHCVLSPARWHPFRLMPYIFCISLHTPLKINPSKLAMTMAICQHGLRILPVANRPHRYCHNQMLLVSSLGSIPVKLFPSSSQALSKNSSGKPFPQKLGRRPGSSILAT
jgi:hypothetical protein